MIKKFNANKILCVALIGICLFFLINPKTCSNACISGVSVWAINVFPVLFPFFILTRTIVTLSSNQTGRLDKFFSKFFNTPRGSLKIYSLSLLSGYPMGAKLICNEFEDGKTNSHQALKMLSFCSMAGPMFIIGTVGVAIMKNMICGIVILASNIIATLINGIIFSKFKKEEKLEHSLKAPQYKTSHFSIEQIVYDSLISVLMVGCYIALSFLLIELLKSLNIINFITFSLSKIFRIDESIISSVIIGIVEITKGAIEIEKLNVALRLKTIILSGIIGFGGLSVMMQSVSFLSKLKLKIKHMFLQKFIQGLISLIIAVILTSVIKC